MILQEYRISPNRVISLHEHTGEYDTVYAVTMHEEGVGERNKIRYARTFQDDFNAASKHFWERANELDPLGKLKLPSRYDRYTQPEEKT